MQAMAFYFYQKNNIDLWNNTKEKTSVKSDSAFTASSYSIIQSESFKFTRTNIYLKKCLMCYTKHTTLSKL